MNTSIADRRRFLQAGAASLTTTALASAPGLARAARTPPLKALAIDGFTTFDPRPILALTEQLFPGRGAELSSLWRTRQFEYSWLRTLMGRYADFWQVTEEAMVFATQQLKLELRPAQRDQLMQAFLSLKAWPDVRAAFVALREAGIRLAFLSNFTDRMLDAASHSAGLADLLDPHLSTDRVRVFKPHPRAYQMGVDAFGLPREQIGFAAFGGWDAAGAKAFGYPTFWVNRTQQATEQLGGMADAQGSNFEALLPWALGS